MGAVDSPPQNRSCADSIGAARQALMAFCRCDGFMKREIQPGSRCSVSWRADLIGHILDGKNGVSLCSIDAKIASNSKNYWLSSVFSEHYGSTHPLFTLLALAQFSVKSLKKEGCPHFLSPAAILSQLLAIFRIDHILSKLLSFM